MNEYILIGISAVTCLASMIISSRKSGCIIGYSVRFKDKYDLDKGALEDYFRIMLLITIFFLLVGAILAQDLSMVLMFTAINVACIGYALAWEKILKPRAEQGKHNRS
jgi:hypothetical protein